MTGPEYMAIRKKFIESLAWLLVQQPNLGDNSLERRLENALKRLGVEVREEVDKHVSD